MLMLDNILLEKVLTHIKENANNREVVLYGQHNEIETVLNNNGYEVNKVFIWNVKLLSEKSAKYFLDEDLRNCKDKYYVVIPFLLDDDGSTQRNSLAKWGYTKFKDYVFYPDDEDADRTLTQIKRYSDGRELVSFGYNGSVEEILSSYNVFIKMRFTFRQDVVEYLNNKNLSCQNGECLKDKSQEYYVIVPDYYGEWQRAHLKSFGFFENKDYCFFPSQKIDQQKKKYDDENISNRLYIPEKYKDMWYQYLPVNYFSSRTLNVDEAENGIILPLKYTNDGLLHGGVFDSSGDFLAGHVSGPERGSKGYVCSGYDINPDELKYLDETVVFGGIMFDHPGHLIVECIAQRLWWYIKHPDSKLKCAILVGWGEGKFVKEFFELFGMPEDQIIIINNPTRFKKIIIPEQSVYLNSLAVPVDFTEGYISVFDHIRKRLKPSNIKKVYFTKRKTFKQDIIGEDYFIDFYEKKGFTIIDPEDYTLRQKAEILFGADEFVAQLGTNTVYSIFCQPSARVQMLSRVNNISGFLLIQNILFASAKITDYYCIDVSLNFLHKEFVWGISLMGITDSYISFVKDMYNEAVYITKEESLKNNLYDYLKRFSEYYSTRKLFNGVKNVTMLSILQNMSEVFLDKEFDTSNLDLSTNESNLQNQVKDLTAQKNTLTTQVNTLTEDNKTLKSAKAQNETEITKLRSEQSKLNAELLDAHRQKDEADKKIVELYQQKDEVYQKLLEAHRQKDETAQKLLAATEEKTALTADISVKNHQIDALLSEKDKLSLNVSAKESELWTVTEKENALESALAVANSKIQSFESEIAVANGKAKSLESELANANNKTQSLESELAAANSKLQSLKSELSGSNQKVQSFEQECAELKNKINWMENTRSWRYTKPFRKKEK